MQIWPYATLEARLAVTEFPWATTDPHGAVHDAVGALQVVPLCVCPLGQTQDGYEVTLRPLMQNGATVVTGMFCAADTFTLNRALES